MQLSCISFAPQIPVSIRRHIQARTLCSWGALSAICHSGDCKRHPGLTASPRCLQVADLPIESRMLTSSLDEAQRKVRPPLSSPPSSHLPVGRALAETGAGQDATT